MKKSVSFKLKELCLYKFIVKDLEKLFNKRKNLKFYQLYTKYIKCKEYKQNLKKYSKLDVDFNIDYVYFPLHMQPELTTSIHGDENTDQLLVLEKLSAILPDNYKIYVKENPKQGYFQRDSLFFKRMMNIDKVVFVDKTINTHELTKNSQFVATISGTAGWEAMLASKKVLLFGRAWYQTLPGAFVYNEEFDYKIFEEYIIDKVDLKIEFESLMSNCFNGLVDMDYKTIKKDYCEKENEESVHFAICKILESKV